MDAAAKARHRRRLRALREEALGYVAQLEDDLEAVRVARSDGGADDEHDPEGPTMSQEWAHVSALLVTARAEVAEVEAALERLSAGTYGFCVECGQPIAEGRLEARPMAELCISCAEKAQ